MIEQYITEPKTKKETKVTETAGKNKPAKKEKEKKDVTNQWNLGDAILVNGCLAIMSAADFVADDLVGGQLKQKIQRKAKSAENKSFFKAVQNKVKSLKPAKKEEEVVTVEEVEYGKELPVVVEPIEEEKPLFTVIPDEKPEEELLSNFSLNNLLKDYSYTGKLIAAAILWMCGKVNEQQIGGMLTAIDSNEEYLKDNVELINSVTKYYSGECFAPNPIYKDKEFNVNPTDLKKVILNLSQIDIMNGNSKFSGIIEMTRDYIKEKTGEYIVIFDNNKLDLFKSDAPTGMISKVEGAFGEFFNGYPYKVSKLPTGMALLSVVYNPAMPPREFVIDPGITFGTDYKVRGYDMAGNDIYVSPEQNHDVVQRIFFDPEYRISMADAVRILDNQGNFRLYDLYVNYDLTNSQQKIVALSFTERESLQNKLNLIRELVVSKYNKFPRMRIKNFKDPDAFIVVSDNKCKIQDPQFASEIVDGLIIKVKGSSYEVLFTDENGNILSKDNYDFIENSEVLLRGQAKFEELEQATSIFKTVIPPEAEEPTVKVDFTKK